MTEAALLDIVAEKENKRQTDKNNNLKEQNKQGTRKQPTTKILINNMKKYK